MTDQASQPGRASSRDAVDDPGASGSSLEMVLSEEIGTTIRDRYRITSVIGEGGMGVVYEAYDSQVDRKVAIKLVRSECAADRKFLTRFRRELEVTTQLRHPSTIRVFEHGTAEDGRPFMVMELLEGVSLADRLEQGRIPEIEALQYARQIAESLSEAHENGIFHRDLKPDNIFIETVGVSTVVKVLDFGIAGGLDATRLTKAGEVFGTPQYMSPEQCNGQTLDHRTDIYSLGCILYEMLEGRPPFSAETPMATMLKHVRAKVPPTRYCCRETAKVLQMALRKDRNKRIQTCGRFAELLGEAIGHARAAKDSPQKLGTGPSGVVSISRGPSTGPIGAVAGTGPITGPIAAGTDSNKNFVIAGVAGVGLLIAAAVFQSMGTGEAEGEEAAETDKDSNATPDLDKLPKNRAMISTNVEGATVLLDGEEICTTPCPVPVPVGDGKDHEIRLRKEGYVEVVQTWQPKSVVEDPPEMAHMRESDHAVKVGK